MLSLTNINKMAHASINHIIIRNGINYVSFRLSGSKYFRRSLEADSHSHAQLLMSFSSPAIPLIKRGTIHPDQFGQLLSDFSNRLKQQNEHWLVQQFINIEQSNIQPKVAQEYRETATPEVATQLQNQAEPKAVLTLAGAWNMYKKEKAQNWVKAISQANERFMEVLMIVLGASTDVSTYFSLIYSVLCD